MIFPIAPAKIKETHIRKPHTTSDEITLKGKVLQIGGLKEKVIGAYINNIDTIFIPELNKDDLVDIDVEIKIDKNGKFRVTLFSHSADQFSNYLDQTQRNGVGLVYQEEFDTFGELFRKIFWSKERREKYEQQKRQEQLNEYLRSIGQSVR